MYAFVSFYSARLAHCVGKLYCLYTSGAVIYERKKKNTNSFYDLFLWFHFMDIYGKNIVLVLALYVQVNRY